jgi:membrane protein DedA with SNARE-associated domain
VSLAERIMDLVARSQGPTGLALIAACALLEYLFPPFPGDLVVVFAAFLVVRHGWSAPGVWAAVLAGSAAGCMIGYAVGRLLHRTEGRWATGWLARLRPRIDTLVERFARHGAFYIAINRFLPSLRALFFVAAGMARLSPWKVLGFGLLSAAAWNAMLFALGITVGANWNRLEGILVTYGEVVWGLIALLVLVLLVRWWWRRQPSAR